MKNENVTINSDNTGYASSFQYLKKQYNHSGSDLRTYQLHLLDAMILFDNWCKSHDIKYSLAYGTLLGAIRHKGFIPWDDDVDLLMDRENFNKLCGLMSDSFTEITRGLYLVNGIRPELYYDPFSYIDIFVFDHSPNNYFLKIIKDTTIKILYAIIKIKTRPKKNKLLSFAKIILTPVSLKKTKHLYSNVVPLWFVSDKNYTYKNIQVYNDIIGCVNKKFLSQDFVDYELVEFEKHLFPAYSHYDSILRTLYGDYMKIPSDKETHGYYKNYFVSK